LFLYSVFVLFLLTKTKFLYCMLHTFLVNIITLNGRYQKRETLGDKASQKGSLYELCSFLFILDMTAFTRYPSGRRMYKKCTFYSYVNPVKNCLYVKNVMKIAYSIHQICMRSTKSSRNNQGCSFFA
jgi:hypothetical protein